MKKLIEKVREMSKHKKVVLASVMVCVLALGTLTTAYALMNKDNKKQDKIADTSIKDKKKVEEKKAQEEKKEEKVTEEQAQEPVQETQTTTQQESVQPVQEQVQNTQQQVTPQPTPQPEPQVCTGVTYDLSRGNSGLLFKTRAEFDAWVEKYDAYWVNGYEKFENEYGHVGWEQVRVIAYDSCGNELDTDATSIRFF